jgi:hypothetical protein
VCKLIFILICIFYSISLISQYILLCVTHISVYSTLCHSYLSIFYFISFISQYILLCVIHSHCILLYVIYISVYSTSWLISQYILLYVIYISVYSTSCHSYLSIFYFMSLISQYILLYVTYSHHILLCVIHSHHILFCVTHISVYSTSCHSYSQYILLHVILCSLWQKILSELKSSHFISIQTCKHLTDSY